MPANCSPTEPVVIDGATLSIIPAGRRRAVLNTLGGVRREMARVYREAEAGKRETSEASRLVYILGQIGKALELAEIEARLKALEVKTNAKQLRTPD